MRAGRRGALWTMLDSASGLSPGSVAIVLGTRPEIIKLAHIIRLLGPAARVVHTGQHYDRGLSALFIEAFELPPPDVHLTIGGSSRGAQIGSAVSALDVHLGETRPLALIVQGDTNTALAGAIAGNAQEIPVLHVEAGLRSYDRRMPEEHNRVLIDHIGDLLFAPTDVAEKNMFEEGVPESRIRVTGNTVIEAVIELLPGAEERQRLLDRYHLTSGGYVLSTFHRPENVDDPERFGFVLRELASLEVPVVLPLHPRSKDRAARYGLAPLLKAIRVIEPVGYQDFLGLGAESAFLVSDSGGVQEEVTVYKRSVIVVRRSTERPEVLGTFAELVEPGADFSAVAERWMGDLAGLHQSLAELPSPYGDGTASARIVDEIGAMVGGT